MSNTLKRSFIYSSQQRKEFCEAILRDKSEANRISSSKVIESWLTDKMLSKNDNANFLICNRLYPKEQPDGIEVKETLDAIFSSNASSGSYDSVHNNLRYIVEFARMYSPQSFTEGICTDYFQSQWEDICKDLERYADNTIDMETRFVRQKSAHDCKVLLKFIDEKEYLKDLSPDDFYRLILEWWDVLCNWVITYKCLMELVRLTPDWKETAKMRSELHDIYISVANAWPDKEPVYYYPWQESHCFYINWSTKNPDPPFIDDGGIGLYANDVFVAHLSPTASGVMWNPGMYQRTVCRAIKDRSIFGQIIEKIKEVAFDQLKGEKLFFNIGPLMPRSEWEEYGFSFNEIGGFYECDRT